MRTVYFSDAAEQFSKAMDIATSPVDAEAAALRVDAEFYALRECLMLNETGLPYANITGPLLLDKMLSIGAKYDAWNDALWFPHIPFDVVLQLLLKHQLLDAKMQGKDGFIFSPLAIAIHKARPDWLIEMINAGADTTQLMHGDEPPGFMFNLLDYANEQQSWMCASILSSKGLVPLRPQLLTLGVCAFPKEMERIVVMDVKWVNAEMAYFMSEYAHAPLVAATRMWRRLSMLSPENAVHFLISALNQLVYKQNLNELSAQRRLWSAAIAAGPGVLFSTNAPKRCPFTSHHPEGVVMQLLLCLLLQQHEGTNDDVAVSVQWLNDGFSAKASDEFCRQVHELLMLHESLLPHSSWKAAARTLPPGLNDFVLDLIFRICDHDSDDVASQHLPATRE